MENLKHILLVDDDVNDIELTRMVLGEQNITNPIDVVYDGVEALDYLYYRGKFADCSHKLPLFMLLDLKMPRVNGIEVLQQIKSDEQLKNIPVVMLTSSSEEKDIANAYKLNVNAYVEKPVTIDQFREVVKQIGLFWAVVNKATLHTT